jgi:hypothetical protein
MTSYSNGTYTLVGVLFNTVTATLDPGATDVTFNLAGLLSTFNISSRTGATVTVNNTVDLADNLVLNTNGGNITLGTLAGVLGTVTTTINGGSFTIGAGLITANLLGTGTITFGPGGGTSIVGTPSSVITLDLGTMGVYHDFATSSDVIDDVSMTFSNAATYTISGSPTGTQVVTVTEGTTSFTFDVFDAGFSYYLYRWERRHRHNRLL